MAKMNSRVSLVKYDKRIHANISMILTCEYRSNPNEPISKTIVTKQVAVHQEKHSPRTILSVADSDADHGKMNDQFYCWLGQAVYQGFEISEKVVT